MKKVLMLMVALGLTLGTVTSFAQEAPKKESTAKGKKGKKSPKKEEKKDEKK